RTIRKTPPTAPRRASGLANGGVSEPQAGVLALAHPAVRFSLGSFPGGSPPVPVAPAAGVVGVVGLVLLSPLLLFSPPVPLVLVVVVAVPAASLPQFPGVAGDLHPVHDEPDQPDRAADQRPDVVHQPGGLPVVPVPAEVAVFVLVLEGFGGPQDGQDEPHDVE